MEYILYSKKNHWFMILGDKMVGTWPFYPEEIIRKLTLEGHTVKESDNDG